VGTRTLITTGDLLAIGPTRWLTTEQTARGCALVVTDRATRAAHTLGATICAKDVPFPGVISPDGRNAAIVVETGPGADAIQVIDLQSGSDHQLSPRPYFGDGSNGHLVWTPDSRTLLFLTLEGQIDFTDANGSYVRLLPLELRETTAQIAIRVIPSP
jgi:Tol biopolymer transport system component